MPEGPSLVIARENMLQFKNKKVLKASGYSKIDKSQLKNKKLTDIKTWGKHLLFCFPQVTVRVHFLLFGSYLINEKKKVNPVLHFKFNKDDLYVYTSAIALIEEDLDTFYDWSADIMNDAWDPKKAKKKLQEKPDALACDAILDQTIFSGAGNIIKNEVLWRVKVHPESTIGEIPTRILTQLIKEVRKYSFDFLKWRKAGVLAKHWQAHTKDICPRCFIPLIKEQTGKTKRRSFFCDNCQVKY